MAGLARSSVFQMSGDFRYVSRGGLKLEAALRAFGVDATGRICADFGSHAGGFVDCLLQHGAARVYAVEPGYGVLDYKLRRDARVVVCERTNALAYTSPEPCDLVTIDVGWTPQRLILPAARRCLREGGVVLTLVKPQYEAEKPLLRAGVLPAEHLAAVLEQCRREVSSLGWIVEGEIESPIRGHGGNVEFLWKLGRRAQRTESHRQQNTKTPTTRGLVNEWRRRESNPRPEAFQPGPLRVCPVNLSLGSRQAGRQATRSPIPPEFSPRADGQSTRASLLIAPVPTSRRRRPTLPPQLGGKSVVRVAI